MIIILPLAWVLMMSMKSLPDAMRGDFWPRTFDFTHYSYVFERIATLPINLFNSIYVTAGTVLITTVCAVLAGYALVHLRPRGAGLVVAALLVSLYFPVRVVSIISIYETQHWLGLINNTQRADPALHHAAAGDQHPDHAQHVPAGAARADRGGEDRRRRPLADAVDDRPADGAQRPGGHLHRQFRHRLGRVSAVPDARSTTRRARTMPVVLAAAQGGQGQWAWPNLAAVYVIVVAPGILAFTFAQKLFFKGLMEGALKG